MAKVADRGETDKGNLEENSNRDDISPKAKSITSESEALKTNSSQQRVQLTWDDVNYRVTINHKEQEILKGVSGFANPGEFLAIMGSSGAGKTTLLNLLAGRINPNSRSSGSIKVNDMEINSFNYKKIAAYITQMDVLLPTMTVKESITFSAKMRIPGTEKEIKEKVDAMIAALRLERVAENIIGSVMHKGISGGERKRTCIAIEIISNPSIIILDEPTSGLDSFTAEVLIDLLKEQAVGGKTVISTIHQPSTKVFNKFDRLLLLSEGYTVYQGPATKSRRYFAKLGYKCPRQVNPADYFMRMLHVVNRYDKTQVEQEMLDELNQAYKENEPTNDGSLFYLTPIENYTVHSLGWQSKIVLLWKRSFVNAARNPMLSKVRIIQYIINGTLVDLLFHGLSETQRGLLNTNGVLFFTINISIILTNNSSALTFPIERPIFLKEIGQGLYGSGIYYIAKNISELPMQIIAPMIYALMTYFALGLDLTAGKFFTFYAIIMLTQMSGVALGYLVGASTENVLLAHAFAALIPSGLMIFGGMYGNLESMNSAFSWIQYVSPFSWAFKSLTINQYRDNSFDCSPDCDPLDRLGFHDPLWQDIICLCALMLGYRILAYVLLRIGMLKRK